MRIHVLGLGAVGSLVAAHLRRALPRQDVVSLIHKSTSTALERIKDGCIKVETNGIQEASHHFRHESFLGKPGGTSSGYIYSLIVCLKAQHTYPILKELTPRLSSASTIGSLTDLIISRAGPSMTGATIWLSCSANPVRCAMGHLLPNCLRHSKHCSSIC